MSWIEVTCEIEEKSAKSLSDALDALGALAVSYFDATNTPLLEPLPGETPFWQKMKCVGLFSEDLDVAHLHEKLKHAFPALTFEAKPLADQDWTRTWLEHYRPMSFGERLWIMPSNVAVVKLDPGLAFGTGTHPTTALCLRWLNDHCVPDTVIDYGCGSGILGIAAKLLGAKTVWAIDYDPQALQSTQDNLLRNHLPIDAIQTLLPEDLPTPLPHAALVMANILAEPLIELAPRFADMCELDGALILSGLLTHQIEPVLKAYQPWFTFESPVIEEEWVLLSAKRCNSSVDPV
jgi:ribosomal protein L11 methyltransferase